MRPPLLSRLVSKLAKELDEKVSERRSRPISGVRPHLIVDARYGKARRGGRTISQGILIVLGINSCGMREILAVETADTENETAWSDLLRDLKRRGLSGVEPVTSDAHEGIKAAASRHFQGASWQRCRFHLIRNLLRLGGKGQKADLAPDLRAIFDSNDPETLDRRLSEILRKWEAGRPAVAEKIDEETIDAPARFCFPRAHRKGIRTAGALERLNQEIKRRARAVRIFPDPASALRLITTLAMEQNEDGDRRYPDMSLREEFYPLDDEMARAVMTMLEEAGPFSRAGGSGGGGGADHSMSRLSE